MINTNVLIISNLKIEKKICLAKLIKTSKNNTITIKILSIPSAHNKAIKTIITTNEEIYTGINNVKILLA